ncbi:hypothetical protein LEN26_019372 [Aphanomyces euteiches]|nr:hypothetical protein LEN26_019372 [Aphanomyces euteiches]
MKNTKRSCDLLAATTDDCTDFLHHLYTLGRKARTVDSTKTAMVALFKENKIEPNPAQATEIKHYVVGLQKYNRQNNIDEEQKAHPLTIHELSVLMNGFGELNHFTAAMFRFLCHLSEMLALKWCDVSASQSEFGECVSVRLRWHKKASVERDYQVYNLVDEASYPCLRVHRFFDEYGDCIRSSIMTVSKDSFVFPFLTELQHGNVKVSWERPMEQNQLRRYLNKLVESNPLLSVNITLHSMRRGGSFFRVFESMDRRFDFRELMAWCRWSDPKTCCEYLVTKSLSDQIDPKYLFQQRLNKKIGVCSCGSNTSITANVVAEKVVKSLCDARPVLFQTKPASTQKTLYDFAVPRTIPTARSAREAWDQWYYADSKNGRPCALKDFSKSMIKCDRRKYSERLTIATAFSKFPSYEHFEREYSGHIATYSTLLKEVRKRKNSCRI